MSRSPLYLTIAVALAGAALTAPAQPALAGSNPATAPQGTIVAGAMASKDHKTLVAAVKAAGLISTLASGGPYTVFAPTDAAFAKLPAGTLDTLLQPANREMLRSILTYHVVPGSVTAEQLIAMIQANGGSAALTTVQGGMLTARLVDGKVVLTDAKGGTATVIAADLKQSNGIIHVTDAVSLPM